MTEPVEVAIVGGGCAGITTAFELTRPEHGGKYHVTLYQMGWRLGGKGASGRGAAARIEEHGLHLWMGFYENSFRLLRECYSELNRSPSECPIADWRDAFAPDPYVGVADQLADGSWDCWSAHFPAGAGDPGDPFTERNPFTVEGYMKRSVALLRTLLESVENNSSDARAADDSSSRSRTFGDVASVDIQKLLAYGALTSAAAMLEALALLELALQKLPAYPTQPILTLISTISRAAHLQINNLVSGDDQLRRYWQMIDVVLACLHGAIRFGLLTHPRGFDAINDYDWREWLVMNGASESSVDSAFMRGIYDLLFAYEDGDTSKPRLAAGQALRGAVRMFMSYRGSVFWKMKAGMGDVVFAPFYEVLKQRGVDFKFFHRLDHIRLASDSDENSKPWVEAMQMTIQATTPAGEDYDPLIDVKALPSWPAEPLYSQLVDGHKLEQLAPEFESPDDQTAADTITLRVSEDFDFVVLAVGLGAVPIVGRELIDSSSRWRDAVANVKTVSTQAFQIWMNEDMAELGWSKPPINLSGFVTPFDTWADMTHLATIEDWHETPKSIAYFCSVLAETDINRVAGAKPGMREVRQNAVHFLNTEIKHLWPDAVSDDGQFRWSLLIDPCSTSHHSDIQVDDVQFNSQYWTANTTPSDRYVQSLPGSIEYRISPLDLDFDNLTVAGDWTDCSHNAGCVEAAIMSGRLAAHALSGLPLLEEIVGYDHP